MFLLLVPDLGLNSDHVQIQRGAGGPDPLENHKAIEILSKTGPDSLKNHKVIKPEFDIGPLSVRR